MQDVPIHISVTFIACIITSLGFLYYAVHQAAGRKTESIAPKVVLIGSLVWLILHSILSFNDFYPVFDTLPPRLFSFVGVTLIVIIAMFATKRSRAFIAQMPITTLTYIHIIRVPVEIVLWWLFLRQLVPESMTFSGINYDIVSGITAPFAGVFLVDKKRQNRTGAIIWNILALGLLLTIVGLAISSSPYFAEPSAGTIINMAIFYFPYSLLPLFVVPVVLFCHLASLYQLIWCAEED